MGNLNGRIAVVTGAGRGIGAAIVQRFFQDEAAGIAILEKETELARQTAEQVDPSGERLLVVGCDVSNEEQVASALKTVIERFQTIDILVNNAAITKDTMFHKMTNEAWEDVIQVNLYGTYYLCKHIIPLMREKNSGRIINFASTAAYGNPGQANYSASKGAVMSLSATLAKECGPKNITVNCIVPGIIDTEMVRAIPKEVLDDFMKTIPMKRLGQPEDVAALASFLASDDAGYITGQCIRVNGGLR